MLHKFDKHIPAGPSQPRHIDIRTDKDGKATIKLVSNTRNDMLHQLYGSTTLILTMLKSISLKKTSLDQKV